MIKFEFNNTYMSDSNDAAAAYENTQFIQDIYEKGIVFIDNRSQLSSLTFYENNLNVNNNNYTFEIRFKIHPNTGNTMILVNGTKLPLTILLEYYNGLFIPLVLLEVNGMN